MPLAAAAAGAGSHINIVVIGDSYSAGNGAGDYYSPSVLPQQEPIGVSDTPSWLRDHGHTVTLTDRACSGGVTDDYWNPRDLGDRSEVGGCHASTGDQVVTTHVGAGLFSTCNTTLRAQRDSVDKSTDLVLFTFGGNDIHFSDIVQQCFIVGKRDPGRCGKGRRRQRPPGRRDQDAGPHQGHPRGSAQESVAPGCQGRLARRTHKLIGDINYVLKSHNILHQVTDTYDAATNVRGIGVKGSTVQANAVAAAETARRRRRLRHLSSSGPEAVRRSPARSASGVKNLDSWMRRTVPDAASDTWYHPNPAGHEQYAGILESNYGDRDPGSSVTEAQGLDLVFVIDTTGSMSGTIQAVKDDVNAVVDKLAEGTSSYRIAVVSYRDQPAIHGRLRDYASRLDLAFTDRRRRGQGRGGWPGRRRRRRHPRIGVLGPGSCHQASLALDGEEGGRPLHRCSCTRPRTDLEPRPRPRSSPTHSLSTRRW